MEYGLSKQTREWIVDLVKEEIKRVSKLDKTRGKILSDECTLELLYLQSQILSSITYEFTMTTASTLHNKFDTSNTEEE